MTKPRLCIDIDNVIAQTDVVMRRVIREYTKEGVKLEYEDIKEFDYWKCNDAAGQAISKDDWDEVHPVFSRPENLMEIQPFPGVQDLLRKLSETFAVHLATSRLHEARLTTVEWLEHHKFLKPYDLHFLKHGEKHSSLARFFAAVEDDYAQARSFAHAGTKCYLIRHPWNRTKDPLSGLHWVHDWAELAPRLLRLAEVWETG
jgi:5'(3')-deoxyribonucleotidase